MGLLVGLPLKLFHILFVVLRLALPLLIVAAVVLALRALYRRSHGQTQHTTHQKTKEPEFDGPVYTVDYEEVDDPEEPK